MDRTQVLESIDIGSWNLAPSIPMIEAWMPWRPKSTELRLVLNEMSIDQYLSGSHISTITQPTVE
jgi:hypothetical protein